MIYMFTDFGPTGPYTGQVTAVLHHLAPGVPIIDLLNNAPAHNPRASAYLLASLKHGFQPGDIILAVVDPGVGSEERRPVLLQADDCWYVGPDNGLFNVVGRQAGGGQWYELPEPEGVVSATFHGRDWFAPAAAALACGASLHENPVEHRAIEQSWPDDLAEIIYIDHFGNAMTGIRAEVLTQETELKVQGHTIRSACTYSDVGSGASLWYENSNGLAEIAINGGNAAAILGLQIGSRIAC